jgi:uncharacterized protein YcfL
LIRQLPISLLAAALLATTLPGCSGANTFATGGPRSNVDLAPQIVRDPGLSNVIEVVSSRIDERGGVNFAQVTIRNNSSSSRSVEYRFDWFDADGVNVTPRMGQGFRTETIGGGESVDLQNSAASRGVDFRFTIRNASR